MKILMFVGFLLVVLLSCTSADRTIHGRVIKERIVGGDIVMHGDVPYIVSLRWYGEHFCGGSILNDHTILTAGHCLFGYEDDDYELVGGEWSLTLNDGTEQFRNVTALLVHTDYDDWTLENDIALMWVDPPFNWTRYVQPINLPPPNHTATGLAPVSGWGVEEEGGDDLADKLKMVILQFIDDETCREELGYPEEVLDSMICAYYKPGGRDSCQGDSGGPMLGIDLNSTYQAAIVSWGYGCARPGMPGMYTEVSHFIDWIEDHIGDH